MPGISYHGTISDVKHVANPGAEVGRIAASKLAKVLAKTFATLYANDAGGN